MEVFERYAPVTEQLLPVVGTVLTLDMLGAIAFVHDVKGLFITKERRP
jgi:hypothetical protein